MAWGSFFIATVAFTSANGPTTLSQARASYTSHVATNLIIPTTRAPSAMIRNTAKGPTT